MQWTATDHQWLKVDGDSPCPFAGPWSTVSLSAGLCCVIRTTLTMQSEAEAAEEEGESSVIGSSDMSDFDYLQKSTPDSVTDCMGT